jgi:hypothetical protein
MLGSAAAFWEDRATRTGVLLLQLATEGERILVELQEAAP